MAIAIPYLKLAISVDVGPVVTPGYSFHSSFRGLFGRTLRQTFCIQNRLDCADCPIRGCLYRRIFEAEGQGHENYRPYIIRHTGTRESRVEMELVILGELASYGSSIMHLLTRMEGREFRLRGQRHPLKLLAVTDSGGATLYRQGSQALGEPQPLSISYIPRKRKEMRLRFVTPLRLKHQGGLMGSFLLQPVLRSIYQRVNYLCSHMGREGSGLPPFAPAFEGCESQMRWQEMYRKSWRQGQEMSLGGLIGDVRVIGPSAQTAGLLKLGELIQAGKQTTFGLGKYEIL